MITSKTKMSRSRNCMKSHKRHRNGELVLRGCFPSLAMLAAVFFSLMQLFVKIVSVYTPTVQVAFMRSVIQGSLAVTVLGIQERTTVFNLSRRILWIVISRGAIGFVSFLCLFFALSKLPLSECVVITYTHPVFADFSSVDSW